MSLLYLTKFTREKWHKYKLVNEEILFSCYQVDFAVTLSRKMAMTSHNKVGSLES